MIKRLSAFLLGGVLFWPAFVGSHPTVYIPIVIQEALPNNPNAPTFEILKGLDRLQEPVTFALPIHEDAEITKLMVIGAKYAQFRPLQRWRHNQKERWLLIDTQADLRAGTQNQRLFLTNGTGNLEAPDLAKTTAQAISIDTGSLQATIRTSSFNLLDSVIVGGKSLLLPGKSEGLVLTDLQGTPFFASKDPHVRVSLEENGPIRAVVLVRGRHVSPEGTPFLAYTLRMHFTKGQSRIRLFYTLQNASLQHPENALFRSAELRLATSLTAPTILTPTHDGGEETYTLQGPESLELFQGISTSPTLGLLDLDPRFWPTRREGSSLSLAGKTLSQTPKDQPLRSFFLQARKADQGSVLIGTRWAAETWPQALRAEPSGVLTLAPFPEAAQNDHLLPFYTHKTHELLLHFAADSPPPLPLFSRFQYPLVGKPLVVDWNNEAESLWEKVVSFQEEADFFQTHGWPNDDKPQATFRRRPTFAVLRHLPFDPLSPLTFEPARLDLYNFLRQEAVFAGVYALQAHQRLSYYADQAIRHCDDFDPAQTTGLSSLLRPDGSLKSARELPHGDRLPPSEIHFTDESDTSAILAQAYWLSGDERLRDAFLSWGKTLLALPAPASLQGLSHRIYNLSHLSALSSDDKARQKASDLLTRLHTQDPKLGASGGFSKDRGFVLTDLEAKTSEPRLSTLALGHLWPRALGFFIDEIASSKSPDTPHDILSKDAEIALDLLEGSSRFLLHEAWFQRSNDVASFGFPPLIPLQTPLPTDPTSDPLWQAGNQPAFHAFRSAYLLAPQPSFLERGLLLQKAAAFNPLASTTLQDLPARQSLQHLLEYPILYRTWRDLPLRVERLSELSYRLGWIAPPATRAYRFKIADRPILDWLSFDPKTRSFPSPPSDATPFFAATSLTDPPSPAPPDSIQSWVIRLPSSVKTPHFSARYLSSDPRPPKTLDPSVDLESLPERPLPDASSLDRPSTETPSETPSSGCSCSASSPDALLALLFFLGFLSTRRLRRPRPPLPPQAFLR